MWVARSVAQAEIATVKTKVEVLEERIAGQKESLDRIEHKVDQLLHER